MFATPIDSIDDACRMLREADRLTARATQIIGAVDVERTCGLPTEMMLVLGARRTGADARMTASAATTLRAMPQTSKAFGSGELSWSQVRAICYAVRSVDAAKKAAIDDVIAAHAERLSRMDPDELVCRVEDTVASLRPDLAIAREDRVLEREYLSIQGRLDGTANLQGELGAESAATLTEALDALAGAPAAPEDSGPSRPQQFANALVAMAERALAGTSGGATRPRPRLYATVDINALADAGSDAARILWSLAGRPARVSPVTTQTLLCDATVVPVLFEGSHPVGVGDAYAPISSKVRAALITRDAGCRFPGCGAPVGWCDAHHIVPRLKGGSTTLENLVLLCRRCHRRVHRRRWRIRLRDDGVMEFATHRDRFESPPGRARRE
jgi:hypothetical protein